VLHIDHFKLLCYFIKNIIFNRFQKLLSENQCPHTHCKAHYFEEETTGTGKNRKYRNCCNDGKIGFPFIQLSSNSDDMVFGLFTGTSKEARLFQQNIRKYNTALAFASVISKLAEFSTRGPPVVIVEGNIQHKIGPLQKSSDKIAAYMQCYFYETPGRDNAYFKCTPEEVNKTTNNCLRNILDNNARHGLGNASHKTTNMDKIK